MFVIEFIYKAPLSEIDAAIPEHQAFLDRGYAAGHFLLSGRKVPRAGGVILAVADDRTEIEALMRDEPFVVQGLADVRIIEFRASRSATDLDARLERELGAAKG